MYLSELEARNLAQRDTGTLVLWRFKVRVANCEPGRCYLSGGAPYTVIGKERRSREEIYKLHSQRPRAKLWALWALPENKRHREVWEIVLVKGDFSDSPRFLAYTGSGSDYTTSQYRAMKGEPPALTAEELANLRSLR